MLHVGITDERRRVGHEPVGLVTTNDVAVRPWTLISLCDGYGGTELALRSVARVRTVARVERDGYAASVLVARMEEQRLDPCPVWDELESFDGGAWRGRVDIVAAGFPCQPFSAAGQKGGVDDDRWLWPAICRIVADMEPGWVLLENVPQLVRHGLPEVCYDLAQLGFDAEWGLYDASAVGAPHKRRRFWLVAHARSSIRVGRADLAFGGSEGREAADRDGEGLEGRGVRQHEPDESCVELAHADRDGQPAVGWSADERSRQLALGCDGQAGAVGGRLEDVGDTRGARRSEVTGSTLGDEGTDGWRQDAADLVDGASQTVADPESVGRWREGFGPAEDERPSRVADVHAGRQRMVWPPRPDDSDGWERWIAAGGPQPTVRRSTDGPPLGLADALHLGGNGLVPQCAAEAWGQLIGRAGWEL